MKVAITVGAFSVALVLALASPASADPIQVFSSFGPGDSFNTQLSSFFGFDEGQEGNPDSHFSRAMSFVPTATAGLTSLEMPLQFESDTLLGGGLQINLFDSAGMIPGGLLESWTQTQATNGITILRFDSALHPMLAAGHTYFIEAAATGFASGSWYLAPGPEGTFSDVRRFENGAWVVGTRSFETTAFRVSGDAAVSATPEPASLLLLGTGMAIAAWRRPRSRMR